MYEILCWFILPVRAIWSSIKLFVFVIVKWSTYLLTKFIYIYIYIILYLISHVGHIELQVLTWDCSTLECYGSMGWQIKFTIINIKYGNRWPIFHTTKWNKLEKYTEVCRVSLLPFICNILYRDIDWKFKNWTPAYSYSHDSWHAVSFIINMAILTWYVI